MNQAVAAVDERRQWDRLMAMARIGAIAGDGVNRACLTELDRQARRLLIAWAGEIGADVLIYGPPIYGCAAKALTRSCPGGHRQPHGHAAERRSLRRHLRRHRRPRGMILHRSGTALRRPVEVVAWTNEEGGRFAPGCMGSMSWSGFRRIEDFADVLDPDGVRFADALASHLASETDLPERPLGGRPHAYVEAHIEQGPRLEAEGLDIGVVTGIQGSRWFTVTLTGETAHAGTTPLAMRRDAVQDMVRAIAALNTLMHDPQDVLRFTVGRIAVEPNTSNSVANRASFTIDLRHPDKDVLLARRCDCRRRAGPMRGASVSVQENFHALPVEFSPRVIDAVERAASEQRRGHMRLPSGAFHDAQFVVPVCPTGMIFVPCHKGISHNPAEYSEPSQLAAGTCVLAQTLTELASN